MALVSASHIVSLLPDDASAECALGRIRIRYDILAGLNCVLRRSLTDLIALSAFTLL